jgi:hypothetical protein
MHMIKSLSIASTLLAIDVPAMAGVVVNSPANNASVASPFSLSATSVSCSGESVTAMGYSFDGGSDTVVVNNESIDTSIASASGSHVLHVKAWGEHGAACVTDVKITVADGSGSGGGGGSTGVPSWATSVSHLQAMDNWKTQHDTGGKGNSSGWTTLVGSPTMNGPSREFVTHYSDAGDERYSVDWGDDTQATHFFYDTWIYLNGTVDDISNLEMDMNQVMSNGQTVIYGLQCSSYDNKWDYTLNTGSPKHPRDHWQASGAHCNPHEWSRNTWHHVQASYSRDEWGKVTYQSVWVDGAEGKINTTVPSAFGLGWGPHLITNFQVDGHGGSGSSTVFMDNLTISRW